MPGRFGRSVGSRPERPDGLTAVVRVPVGTVVDPRGVVLVREIGFCRRGVEIVIAATGNAGSTM